ncbi:hypothetical protein G4B88_016005 [Cannabis sativa]|nr:hypothetical protein G4B88_016005 [Cannabis sativa]
MLDSFRNSSKLPKKQQNQEKEWLGSSFKAENFIPGLVIGFICGLLFDLSKAGGNQTNTTRKWSSSKLQTQDLVLNSGDQELKMVLIVRQDLKMKSGKIASQCARKIFISFCFVTYLSVCTVSAPALLLSLNLYSSFTLLICDHLPNYLFHKNADAATGMYAELMQSRRSLLKQWEQCGQPKIVLTCKNQQEMNKLKEEADSIGLPTFVVADAGRTQVSSGSRTVLAIGPGPKVIIDSVSGKQNLL